MKRVSLSHEEVTIQKVLEWYEYQAMILGGEKTRVLAGLRSESLPSDSRFFGLAYDDIEEFFDRQRNELEFLAMLSLLAATEAAIRVDFIVRVQDRWKDQASRRFREISRRRPEDRIRLEEDILEPWKDLVPTTKGPIGYFKGALKLRHWLAHGRYWNAKLGRTYSPGDVYDISAGLLQTLGLL